ISAVGTSEIAFSFNANSDRLHGATAAAGKVFFAPAKGIDWIDVPASAKAFATDIAVHHLDLGSDDNTPRRTGSFLNFQSYVLFLAGKGPQSFLGLIDARQPMPQVMQVALDVDPNSRASAPFAVLTRAFGPLAFVFHD